MTTFSIKPGTQIRTLLFGAAMFFASAIGSWRIRSLGLETGVLEFGGRVKKAVLREIDPTTFGFWESFFFWATVVCTAFGVVSVLLAWLQARRNSPNT